MIGPEHLEYQAPDDADHMWGETYFFPVSVPEHGLYAHLYVMVRPVLGVMTNDVYVYGSVSSSRTGLLHYHVRNHLPAPAGWSKIESEFGLTVVAAKPPREFRIDYEAPDGTELHVDWVALMEPFDIHDPNHSPNAGRTEQERIERSSAGAAYTGHFDMTGRMTGTMTVRGRTFEVDTVDRMDRSWGPRPESILAMNTFSANFGEDLALHFRAKRDLAAPPRTPTPVEHGYVMEDGEVHGITHGEYVVTRLGSAVVGVEAELTDRRGRSHRLHASPIAGAPWTPYAGVICWNGMMRWSLDGRFGHGFAMDNTPMEHIVSTYGGWPDAPHAVPTI